MKTIGLIGGMSWQSTVHYYRLMNEDVARRLGGHNNARSVIASVNFAEVEALMREDDWKSIHAILVDAGRQLERAGADMALLCTNTMHKLADALAGELGIPLLNIIDVTAAEIREAGLDKVALLGTRFVMREEFYRKRLEQHGIESVIPEKLDQFEVDRIIFEELTQGRFLDSSRDTYLRIIDRCKGDGARGVILGCTEIGLLLHQRDCALPLFDTTRIHVRNAIEKALQQAPGS